LLPVNLGEVAPVLAYSVGMQCVVGYHGGLLVDGLAAFGVALAPSSQLKVEAGIVASKAL
jgi:hypothetical protein